MTFLETNTLNYKQKETLRKLWNKEYPKNINHNNTDTFDNYINSLTNTNHVLVINNNVIMGWYADFEREDERWFLMILDHTIQGKGIGTKLLQKAKEKQSSLNGWVVISNTYLKADDTMYQSPLAFYKKLGFTIFENIILNSGNIKAIKIQFIR